MRTLVFFVVAVYTDMSAGIVNIIGTVCSYSAQINLCFMVFNLIPIPPLDGSRLATALLPAKYYFKIMQYERYIMIGLFVLLFTGILSTPLSFLSNIIFNLIYKVTSLIF